MSMSQAASGGTDVAASGAEHGGLGPERWTKGRQWDGLPPYCDPATAEDLLKWLDINMRPEGSLLTYLNHTIDALPDKRATTYVDGKGKEVGNVSFRETQQFAQRIAAYLQRECGLRPGDRVVLLYPPGPEFILSFLGCLYAGVVAVPVYPPHPYRMEQDLPKFNHIVRNSGAQVALTDGTYNLVIRGVGVQNLLSRVGLFKHQDWPSLKHYRTDKIRHSYKDTTLPHPPTAKGDNLLFLQYTSGSTGPPKGVMVSHASLLSQLRGLFLTSKKFAGYSNNHNMFSWLPMYHDTGLIGMCLAGLLSGTHLVSMTPIAFLQDPSQWLLACHRWRAAVTAVPSFALTLACRRTSPAVRDTLDLSCLKMLNVGANMTRLEDVEGFLDYFAPSKIGRHCIVPAYSLGEYTLCASGHAPGEPLPVLNLDAAAFETTGKVRPLSGDAAKDTPRLRLVGVGPACDATTIVIVDPASGAPLGEGCVGQVWVDGPAKARGYYREPERSAEAFGRRLSGATDADLAGRSWVSGDDRGFLWQGVLYVVGRNSEAVTIGERTLCPFEVEATAEACGHGALLKPGCSAAFALQSGVGYVAELRSKVKKQDELRRIADCAKTAIEQHFKVPVCAVVLLEPRAIHKTCSGQVRRLKCKADYLNGSLQAVHIWEDDAARDGRTSQEAKEERFN